MPSPLLIQILAIALLVMAACTTVRGPADLAPGPDADARSRAALQADAITRVQASPLARAVLGDQVAPGEPARGDVVASGPGGHAVLTVPVAGTRGRGRIDAVAHRSRDAWRFSRLVLAVDGGSRLDLSPSPPADPLVLPPPGSRVYLLPIGTPDLDLLLDLPGYYAATLGLEVAVLLPVPMDPAAENPGRGQIEGERTIASMRRALGSLGVESDAVVVGVTDRDLYVGGLDWRYALAWRSGGHLSIVSTARLSRLDHAEAARVRLRKLITKQIGILAYRLPVSLDPTSVLYGDIGGPEDLDPMGEEFLGADGQWRPWPQEEPCLSIARVPGGRLVWWLECQALPTREPDAWSFVTYLGMALPVFRQTDVLAPDDAPVDLVRMHRPHDETSRAFGIGANHPLDTWPIKDGPTFRYLEWIQADGGRLRFTRISPGTSYHDARFRSPSGQLLEWNGNGWSLTGRDGWTRLFPAVHSVERAQQAALVGMRDRQGREVRMTRDAEGRLLEIQTPTGRRIELAYDGLHRITRVVDDGGRVLEYDYDTGGRLARVGGSSGREARFTYDAAGRLLTVEVGDDAVALALEYGAERAPVRLALGDGRLLTVGYHRGSDGQTAEIQVTGPDGWMTRLARAGTGYVRLLPQPPRPVAGVPSL